MIMLVIECVAETFLHNAKPCTMWAQLRETLLPNTAVSSAAIDCLDIVWKTLHDVCGLKRDYADYLHITHDTRRLLWEHLKKNDNWPQDNSKEHMSACLFVMARRQALRGGFWSKDWYNISHGHAVQLQYPYTDITLTFCQMTKSPS
jgi:hypothetical protein